MKRLAIALAIVAAIVLCLAGWSKPERAHEMTEIVLPQAAKVAESPEAPMPFVAPIPEPEPGTAPVTKPNFEGGMVSPFPVEKTTVLSNGKVLIENKKVMLRYANGKTEQRFVKITATPVQKPVQKVLRKKTDK